MIGWGNQTVADENRKLVAIMSADVVGYSQLMAADEAATVKTLQDYRAVITRLVERHKGRIVNAPGDNILADFPSAVEAVECASEIQQVLKGRNLELNADRRMAFRIGINLGDVIEEADGTIYGDGVNIAARMEALANTGGICVSNTIYDAVEGKLDFGFEFLGEQQVKNIDRPIAVYRVRSEAAAAPSNETKSKSGRKSTTFAIAAAAVVVAVVGLAIWFIPQTPPPDTNQQVAMPDASDPIFDLPDGPVIAVIPFQNLSGDPEQEFFATGLTEDIINRLTRFNRLFVIARNSTAKYKGSDLGVKQIAEELGARYVVEGTVRRLDDTVRITVQVVEPESGTQLWSETYDRDLTGANLFDIQDQITQNAVATIGDAFGIIFRADIDRTARKAPTDLAGYDCWLRALDYYERFSPEEHKDVRDCAERVVEVDPDSVDAWITLAFTYLDEARFSFNPRPDSLNRARDAALNALKYDPDNLYARQGLAEIYFTRGEMESFYSETARVITLNPNSATSLAALGDKMIFSGELERGLAMMNKAVALMPDHPDWMLFGFTHYHYMKSEYSSALGYLSNSGMRDFFWTHAFLAAIHGQLGRQDDAANSVGELLRLYPEFELNARDEMAKWSFPEKATEHFVEGLRKAGLDVPDKSPLTQ